MPGHASWSWSSVMGVTISGVCWQSVYTQTGDFTHTCLHKDETIPCTATVRFLNGQKVKYTFTCTAIEQNAGIVRRLGNDLIIERFDSEEWL